MKKGITRRDALKLSGLALGGLAAGGCKQPLDPMERNDLINSLLPYYPGREKLGEDEMRITFMGTSPIPRLAQECSSVFVEVGGGPDGTAADQFVFDCGSGVIAKLKCKPVEPLAFYLSNFDEFVKSRHPGENRGPESCNYLKLLDTGFCRYDDFVEFSTFYENVNFSRNMEF